MVKYFNHIPQYITSYEENTYIANTVYLTIGHTRVSAEGNKSYKYRFPGVFLNNCGRIVEKRRVLVIIWLQSCNLSITYRIRE